MARAQFEKLGWGEELFELIVGADSGARAGPCVAVRPCGRVAVWPCGRVAVWPSWPSWPSCGLPPGSTRRVRRCGAPGCRAAGGGCSDGCSGGRELGVPKPPCGREHATHSAAPSPPSGTQPT